LKYNVYAISLVVKQKGIAFRISEKEMAAKQVLEQLNDVWPGIEGQVEMTNVGTRMKRS